MARTLAEHIRELDNDPEFVAEYLALELAEQVLARLEQLGLSRADLARRLGVSPAYITKILRGANVSLATVAKIAVALRADPKIALEPRDAAAHTAVWRRSLPHLPPAKPDWVPSHPQPGEVVIAA